MSHDIEHDRSGGGILSNNYLWIGIGIAIFVVIGFILPLLTGAGTCALPCQLERRRWSL